MNKQPTPKAIKQFKDNTYKKTFNIKTIRIPISLRRKETKSEDVDISTLTVR